MTTYNNFELLILFNTAAREIYDHDKEEPDPMNHYAKLVNEDFFTDIALGKRGALNM